MNVYVSSAIAELKEKLNAYVALMNYRYINLCVKAELGSLLPVTVSAVGKELNIEDVAQIATPNEYQLDVYPKLNDYQQGIIEGIFDVHPEFKLEILQIESSDDKRDKHLLYTMPDVDKERYDLLNNMAKVFRDECNVDIDKECALHTDSLPELTGKLTPEDMVRSRKPICAIWRKAPRLSNQAMRWTSLKVCVSTRWTLKPRNPAENDKEEAGSNHALGLFLSLQKRNAPPIVLWAHREVQPDGGAMLL